MPSEPRSGALPTVKRPCDPQKQTSGDPADSLIPKKFARSEICAMWLSLVDVTGRTSRRGHACLGGHRAVSAPDVRRKRWAWPLSMVADPILTQVIA